MKKDRKNDPEITEATLNNLSDNYAPPEPGDREEKKDE